MTEHRLANILRAIADGKAVQGKWDGDDDWWDYEPDVDSFYVRDGLSWRIKPKPKVKKWRWIYKDKDGKLNVGNMYYKNSDDFNKCYTSLVAVEPVQSTMIEVEEYDE